MRQRHSRASSAGGQQGASDTPETKATPVATRSRRSGQYPPALERIISNACEDRGWKEAPRSECGLEGFMLQAIAERPRVAAGDVHH